MVMVWATLTKPSINKILNKTWVVVFFKIMLKNSAKDLDFICLAVIRKR